ncbi:MAG: alpha/beta fold hydrolase [Candidatus Promineifilaceae bacterium]
MPYAVNHDERIHYKIEGGGLPLVLVHPFAGSLEDYYELGFVNELQKAYRLILVDSRGHGASDKPHDPNAYLMQYRVADVIAILDDLMIDKAHFFGYSMGGRIGFAITKYAPERFYSLIIGGAQPYRNRESAEPHPWIPFLQQGIETAIDKYTESRGSRITAERKARLLTNDPDALIAMLSIDETLDQEPDLPMVTIPCLVYAGSVSHEHEAAKRSVITMQNASFISLPGLDHYDGLRRSDLVIPIVKDFLSNQSTT